MRRREVSRAEEASRRKLEVFEIVVVVGGLVLFLMLMVFREAVCARLGFPIGQNLWVDVGAILLTAAIAIVLVGGLSFLMVRWGWLPAFFPGDSVEKMGPLGPCGHSWDLWDHGGYASVCSVCSKRCIHTWACDEEASICLKCGFVCEHLNHSSSVFKEGTSTWVDGNYVDDDNVEEVTICYCPDCGYEWKIYHM